MIFNCRFKSIRYAALVGGMVVSVLFPADQSPSIKIRAKAGVQELLKKGKEYLDDEQVRRWAKRSAIEVGVVALCVGGFVCYKRFCKKSGKENNNNR